MLRQFSIVSVTVLPPRHEIASKAEILANV